MMGARLSQVVVHSIGAILPATTAMWAEKLFMTPPKPRILLGEDLETINSAHRSFLDFEGKRIALYSWGDGPTVILVHGWGSRAGRMTSFVKPLLKQGFSVVAFDSPAHGESEGARTSLLDVANCLKTVDEWCGHAQFAIGHSMGGAAVLISIANGLGIKKGIVIGSPSELTGISLHFAYETGLPENARRLMQKQLEKRFGVTWDNLSAQKLSQNVKTPILVCHDSEDREVSWNHGAAIAAVYPNSTLFTTHGLGHKRIVKDQTVVARCLEFLK